ncbi:MAG: hypothetical protein QM687_09320 [Ferruginibacter sp.]
MIRLGKEPGYLNGHVPSTAINSMIASLTALLFSYNRIVLTNERSASEGNVVHDGREVNHQYSKSLDFEGLIADVLARRHRRRARATSRCSVPTPKRRIAKLFARETRFDHVFSSCNRNFKLRRPRRSALVRRMSEMPFHFPHPRTGAWTYDRLLGIFGQNFLDMPGQRALLPRAHRPRRPEAVGMCRRDRGSRRLPLCPDRTDPDWETPPSSAPCATICSLSMAAPRLVGRARTTS